MEYTEDTFNRAAAVAVKRYGDYPEVHGIVANTTTWEIRIYIKDGSVRRRIRSKKIGIYPIKIIGPPR